MPSSNKPITAQTSSENTGRKPSKDTRLRMIIIIGIILVGIVSIPFISSIRYSVAFRTFEDHLSSAIENGNNDRTILITTKDGKWLPAKDIMSTYNVLLESSGMGRIIDRADIPEDSEKMAFEFGDGKYMNVYSVQIEDKNRPNHKGVVIEYWEEDYGPYVYENDELVYYTFESILTKSEHSKKLE